MFKKSSFIFLLFVIFSNIFAQSDVINSINESIVLENLSKDFLCEKIFDQKSPALIWSGGQGRLEIGFYNRVESFYADNTSYLSGSKYDQIFYAQNTTDIKFYVKQADALRSRLVIRNKFRAGEPESLGKTSDSFVKILDSEEGSHSHYIGKLLFWVREGWFEATLNDLFCLKTRGKHYLKLGVFPFVLGRGISLGDAYAVSPGTIGFFSNNVIDQYAPGVLLYGDLVPDRLQYDFYFSILRNYAGSFKDVNAKVFKNEIGRAATPWRGFGHINFVFAARLIGIIPDLLCSPSIIRIEPYGFFNNDPEMKVEFDSDASSKLATIGAAIDYEGEIFEWGIEMAANFGNQKLRPWDRNYPKEANRNGTQVVEYTKVYDSDSFSTKALVSNANKAIVASSAQGVAFNGKEIASSGLYNADDRFRAAKTNQLKGAMFVADASINWSKKVKLSSALQIASGDENPNKRPLDNTPESISDDIYSGFVPFQSIYSGKRVLSLFFLGSGRVARPLSVPPGGSSKYQLAGVESGFTNLLMLGFGADIESKIFSGRDARFRPNVIFGWQAYATKKYDIDTLSSLDEPADKYLGVEVNLFGEVELYRNLRMFLVTGFFLPGSHFDDIKGIPLNQDNLDALKNPVCGSIFDRNSPPVLSNKVAFLFNVGMIYNF